MQLTLYYAPNTCALAPFVNLAEAGAAFDVHAMNFRKAEHMSPDYLAINPKHKVPMLVIDGERLTENVAIQVWIARQFPAAKLLPADPMGEIKAISLMGWFGSGIHPHLARINSPTKFCDAPGSEESVPRLAAKQLHENFKIADDLLKGREFFFDHFTAVDPYFFWCFRRATQFKLPLEQYSHCQAHFARIGERPSVRRVFAFETETLARHAA